MLIKCASVSYLREEWDACPLSNCNRTQKTDAPPMSSHPSFLANITEVPPSIERFLAIACCKM